jgi:signal transduction histidine kinase/ActR/RegA family two-component response regulator
MLHGDTAIHALMRQLDWHVPALGHVDTWPAPLRMAFALMLESRQPMSLLWGPERTLLYNEPYVEFLGEKHPAAFARPAEAVWPEVWSFVGPLVQRAEAGESIHMEDVPLAIQRGGRQVDAWFSYYLTPLRGDEGRVGGIHSAVMETTARVLAERRRSLLLSLGDALKDVRERDAILQAACQEIRRHMQIGHLLFAETTAGASTRLMRHGGETCSPGPALSLQELLEDDAAAPEHGRALVVRDIGAAPWAGRPVLQAACAALEARALLLVPLARRGHGAVLGLSFPQPQSWADGDILLVEELARRTFAAIEQADADEALRTAKQTLEDRVRARTQELEQARAEALRSAQRLQFTLDAAEIGDWYLDLGSDQAYRSLRHDQCFGYDTLLPEWGFATFIRHVHPDDRDFVQREFDAATRSGEDWNFECRVVWPDQSIHWIAAHGTIYQSEGRADRMSGIVLDITERKRGEEELRTANRRKDEFLAMLAHELRNPLAPISAAAEVLRLTPGDAARVRQTAEVISRQVQHMGGLVDDLLDVSRVTRGLISLDVVECEVADIVADAVEQARPLIEARQHELRLPPARGGTRVRGDAKRLVQVLVNLLHNAAKFTPEGGRIRLQVEETAGEVALHVSDNGIGMSRDFVGRTFELFSQAERSPDRSQGGLGIGLALVESLVSLHGGRVSASSHGPGLGSRFSVILPSTHTEAAAPSAPATAPPHVAPSPLRILVVDDNHDAAKVLGMLCEVLGHAVTVEHDSADALARAASDGPDLCLLDIGLPGMDGYQMARALRANATTAHMRLVAVTGYGSDQDKQRAAEAGFDDHLVKPIHLDRLATVLGKARGRSPATAVAGAGA